MLHDKFFTLLLLLLCICVQCYSPQDIDDTIPLEETRILSVSHYMDFQENISTSTRQGCAVFRDYLFVFHNTNDIIEIYDLKTKQHMSTIKLYGSELYCQEYHCNNANFGEYKLSSDDDFPLLYVSMEHMHQHTILVLRIKERDNSFSVELVQRIELPHPEDISMYYTNCYVDNNDGVLWVSGYTSNSYTASEDNYLRYVKYTIPRVSLGQYVILQESDVLSSCMFESISSTQGGIIINRKLHQVFGINSPRYYIVFDLNNSAVVFKNELHHIDCEPEGLFFWNEDVFYTSEQSVFIVNFSNSLLFD